MDFRGRKNEKQIDGRTGIEKVFAGEVHASLEGAGTTSDQLNSVVPSLKRKRPQHILQDNSTLTKQESKSTRLHCKPSAKMDGDLNLVIDFGEDEPAKTKPRLLKCTELQEPQTKPDDRKKFLLNRFPKFQRVLTSCPHDNQYLPIACEDGTRLYVRLKEDSSNIEEEDQSALISFDTNMENLINDWRSVKSKANTLKEELSRNISSVGVINTILTGSFQGFGDCLNELWTEKYKPRCYLDLISTEKVNSCLLHWIKLWDKTVFGHDYLAKLKTSLTKHANVDKNVKKTTLTNSFNEIEEYDGQSRPVMKIALISGDPGLGKTTCVHVIAKHAGYKVKEINASDDRSVETFKRILRDTNERSELLNGGKPKCLILDEIDGASAASIKVLVEYAKSSTKNKDKTIKQRRPIICICNDLYAPCLRQLKKEALVIQFPKIPIMKLVERLREVTFAENISVDDQTLYDLCEKSECDIRTCLLELQYLKTGGSSSHQQALTSIVAEKDKFKGLYSVWKDIFTEPKKPRYANPAKPEMNFFNILKTVQNHGEFNIMFGGIFENYLGNCESDSNFKYILEGLDWARWFETFQNFIKRSQNYSIYSFLPMYFVAAHFLYSRKSVTSIINFPSQIARSEISGINNTLKPLINAIDISTARFNSEYSLITDVLPAILKIIQPNIIRSIAPQCWSPTERNILKNVVDIMITYKLDYVQSNITKDSLTALKMDPDIAEIIKFKTQEEKTKTFSNNIKLFVAKEIQMEKIRKNEFSPEIVQVIGAQGKQNQKGIWTKKKSEVPRDFFGRPIVQLEETTKEADVRKRKPSAVCFRYKEGYTNAVKKILKMKDLI